MNTTAPITVVRRARGKGLRGKAARERKQQAAVLHLEQLRGSGQPRQREEPSPW